MKKVNLTKSSTVPDCGANSGGLLQYLGERRRRDIPAWQLFSSKIFKIARIFEAGDRWPSPRGAVQHMARSRRTGGSL